MKICGGDNCVCYGGHVGLVKNIMSDGTKILLLVQRFKKLEAAFCDPMISSDLGIYVPSDLSINYDVCLLNDVSAKYVLLPIKDGRKWVGIPLSHAL